MSVFWFSLNNLLAVAISILITGFTHKGHDRAKKLLVAVALFPVIVLLTILLTGITGNLNNPSIAVLLTIVLIILASLEYYDSRKNHVGSVYEPTGRPFWKVKLSCLAVFSVLIFFITFLAVDLLLSGTAFGWDDFGYHASIPAQWLADGILSVSPEIPSAYFPHNPETLSLWFMLPFHSDTYAGIAGLYWFGLIILAVFVSGILSRHGFATVIMISALVFSSPVVLTAVRTFSAVDIAGPAMLIVALVLTLPARHSFASELRRDGLYSAIFAGYAIGCKVTFVPVVIVLFSGLLIRAGKFITFRQRLKIGSVFIAGLLVCGSFWYAQNILLTGNPFFPAQIGLWDGPWSSGYLNGTKLISWLFSSSANWERWRFLIAGYVDWPIQIFIFSLIGYLGAMYFLLRGQNLIAAEKQRMSFLLLAGIVFSVTFLFMPFSGTNAGTDSLLRVDQRFLIAPFIIGLLLLAIIIESTKRKKLWFFFIVLALLLPIDISFKKYVINLVMIPVLPVAFYLIDYAGNIRSPATSSRIVFPAILIPVLLALAMIEPVQKQRTGMQVTQSIKSGNSGKAWWYLEQLPVGSVITQIGYKAYEYYPLFGRSLQHQPVKVDAEGNILDPLYVSWLRDPEKTRSLYVFDDRKVPAQIDYASFVPNLIDSRVQYVLFRKYPYQVRWFRKRNLLQSSGRAERIYADSQNEIYSLNPDPDNG